MICKKKKGKKKKGELARVTEAAEQVVSHSHLTVSSTSKEFNTNGMPFLDYCSCHAGFMCR